MSNKVFWGILVLIVVGFGFIFATQKKSDTTLSRDDIKTIEGLKEVEKKDKNHVQAAVQYPESPPIGGNHSPVWVGCDQKSYDQEVQSEMAVHALEHGGVWITYLPTLEQSKITAIKDKVKTSAATFSSPYNTQKSPITLSAWGKQLEVNDVSDPRIDQFLVKFRKSPQAPEPGATCTAPEGSAGMSSPGRSQPSSGSGGLAPGETPEQHAQEQQSGQQQ